jgi:hypothetical protein
MEADRSFPSRITDTRPTRLAVWLWATVMEGPCICMYYLHGSSFLLESCQVPGMFCRHVNFHASTCTCLWVSNWTVSDIRARTHLRSRWSASATECECASRLCCPIDAWSRVSPHRVSMVLQFSKQRCDICPLIHSLPLHSLFIFTHARDGDQFHTAASTQLWRRGMSAPRRYPPETSLTLSDMVRY